MAHILVFLARHMRDTDINLLRYLLHKREVKTMDQIAREMGYCRATLHKSLKRLKLMELVNTEDGRGIPYQYRVDHSRITEEIRSRLSAVD
jgi:predicted transcriptional regulator